jgi:hypothetical protein
MGSIIAQQTCSLSIVTQCIAMSLLSIKHLWIHHPYEGVTKSTVWLRTIILLNLNYGCCVWDPLGRISWTLCLATSLAFHPVSNTTRSGSLIGKKKLGSRNRWPLNRPRGLRTYVGASIWILASCKPCLWTTRDQIRGLTGLLPHEIFTLCIYWLLMKLQDTCGSSSQNPRSRLWTSSINSWTVVAMN